MYVSLELREEVQLVTDRRLYVDDGDVGDDDDAEGPMAMSQYCVSLRPLISRE